MGLGSLMTRGSHWEIWGMLSRSLQSGIGSSLGGNPGEADRYVCLGFKESVFSSLGRRGKQPDMLK